MITDHLQRGRVRTKPLSFVRWNWQHPGQEYFVSSLLRIIENTSMEVSIPSPFRRSLAWVWRTIEQSNPHFGFTRSNSLQYGVLPLFFKAGCCADPVDAGDWPKH